MKKADPIPSIVPFESEYFPVDEKDVKKVLSKIKAKEETRIVFFGTPEFSAYILEKLIKHLDNQYDGRSDRLLAKVQAVVTASDKAVGRHQTLQPSAVSLVADKYKIPCFKPDKLDEGFREQVTGYSCDLMVVASYGKIIPQSILDLAKLGAINVHPSLLPLYRGASPIQTTILNGDKKTGVSIMLMDEKMDHGPILMTRDVSISDQDNYQTLSKKLMQESAELLIGTLEKFISGKITAHSQNHEKATFTKILKKEDGFFDIDSPPDPEKLDRMIRAYSPWPGVFTKWNGKIVKFLPENLIQMEGKKALTFKQFLAGYPDFPKLLPQTLA